MFTSLLTQHGIIHRVTCPNTFEQNGIVKTKHRHMVEVGLILLAQAYLHMKYWGYAFSCAVHLINWLPTPVPKNRSLFFVLHGTPLGYDHLQVFGFCCYPYLCPFNQYKLEFWSQPCTFLGYNSHHKGYQCLALDGRVFISHHMVFDEDRFLFTPSSSTSSVPPELNRVTTFLPILSSRPLHKIPFVPVVTFLVLLEAHSSKPTHVSASLVTTHLLVVSERVISDD